MALLESLGWLISTSRPAVLCSESDLHAWLRDLLDRNGFAPESEVRLGDQDRVDFMVGGVAVELKVDGSRAAVLRQLDRYASHDRVEAVLLVTTLRKHLAQPIELRGKPIQTAWVCTL